MLFRSLLIIYDITVNEVKQIINDFNECKTTYTLNSQAPKRATLGHQNRQQMRTTKQHQKGNTFGAVFGAEISTRKMPSSISTFNEISVVLENR